MRLFLDANILFTAAHNPRGRSALLFEYAAQGVWELLTSALAIEEARRNLAAKHVEAIRGLECLLAVVTVGPVIASGACPLELPEKDRPIFESAVACGATHLLTGDLQDFGPHMNEPERTNGIVIQTVARFFEGLVDSVESGSPGASDSP